MWNEKIFLKALFHSTKAHEKQKMFYPENMPYSAHVYGVLQYAMKGCYHDENKNKLNWDLVVQCALLHDIIEDTKITYETIKKEFGAQVSDGVLALTKNPKLDYNLQMQDSINRIKQQPREIAIVKLADRIFNMRGRPKNWSIDAQEKYCKEAQIICNELGYASPFLKNQLQEYINNYEAEKIKA